MKIFKHLLYITSIVLLIFWVLILSSCNPQRKLHKALDEIAKHPIESAKYCADKYPPKDTIIKGDSVVVYDTLWGVYNDTTYRVDTINNVVTKIVPKIITKTITIRDTVYRENTARVEQLNLQYDKCESKYQELFIKYEKAVEQGFEYKKQRNKMRLWFWILVGAIGGYTFLRVRKLIPF